MRRWVLHRSEDKRRLNWCGGNKGVRNARPVFGPEQREAKASPPYFGVRAITVEQGKVIGDLLLEVARLQRESHKAGVGSQVDKGGA